MTAEENAQLQVSRRILDTDVPVIVHSRRVMALQEGTLSLAQGIVHWQPPPSALEHASTLMQQQLLADSSSSLAQQQQMFAGSSTAGGSRANLSCYGPDEGLPALRAALKQKLAARNHLAQHDVMVTSGANQAFINLALALLDPSQRAVLFRPYYFNHHMALQMALPPAHIVYGDCHPATLHPSLEWLQAHFAGPHPANVVVICNPCNPTGVLLPPEVLQALSDECRKAGAWLVLDNTYEDFVFDGAVHHCPPEPHVVHVFSFSKAYGMMGWRVGYIAHHTSTQLGEQLLKAQDTIAICCMQLSQHLALQCLQPEGQAYMRTRIDSLTGNREIIKEAVDVLGTPVVGGQGIYFWVQLPEGQRDDEVVVEWLVKQHRVCVVPGTSCGAPGYMRVAFANLEGSSFQEAARRLQEGLAQLRGGAGPEAGAAQTR